MSSLAQAYATVTAGLHAEFPVNPGIPQEMAEMLARLDRACHEDAKIGTVYPVADLRLTRGFWYLATPYAKWVNGHEDAFHHAAALGGRMLAHGVYCFTPIAHSHPMAECAPSLGHVDHSIWMPFDKVFVDAAVGILVANMDGWRDSKGVGMEIAWAREAGKPVFLVDPIDLSFRVLEP